MAPGITAAPTPDDIARNQAAARAAVAKGAPRDKVVQRLQAAGIPVPPDLMPMPVPGY